MIGSSERRSEINITLALCGYGTRSGVGADDPIDFRAGSSRTDNHTTIPGKRSFIRRVPTSFGCSLGDDHTLAASLLVGDGPLWKTVGEAEEEVSSPETVGGNELGSALTVDFAFAIQIEFAVVTPKKTLAFTL